MPKVFGLRVCGHSLELMLKLYGICPNFDLMYCLLVDGDAVPIAPEDLNSCEWSCQRYEWPGDGEYPFQCFEQGSECDVLVYVEAISDTRRRVYFTLYPAEESETGSACSQTDGPCTPTSETGWEEESEDEASPTSFAGEDEGLFEDYFGDGS